MPIAATVRSLPSKFAVTPDARGGYTRAARPDPNDPTERMPSGTYSINRDANSPQPTTTSAGNSALAANLALASRGMATRRAADLEHSADAARRGVAVLNTVALDPKWEALRQALYEANADKVTTGAARGWDAPGAFDQPTVSADQQQREDYLRAQDVNRLVGALQTQRRSR